MKLLLLNTCGAQGIVALAEDDEIVAHATLPARAASESLMPAIRGLFAAQSWRVADLGAIAVVNGPGSFTGVRVGLAAAKGLCEAGGVCMVAISRLALLASAFESSAETVGLLDAGRGEYYCGVYLEGVKLMEELVRRTQAEDLLVTCRGVSCEPQVAAGLAGRVDLIDEPGPRQILAAALGRIAAADWSDVALTDANYLRRTDAELLARQQQRTLS